MRCPSSSRVCLLRSRGEPEQGLTDRRAERVQLGQHQPQRAALYCRVSTTDQSCERQERDLVAFARRAGYEVVGIYKETASGVKLDRAKRKHVLALVAQGRSYRLVGREVGLSKNTVADIVKRARAQPAHERSNVPGPCR